MLCWLGWCDIIGGWCNIIWEVLLCDAELWCKANLSIKETSMQFFLELIHIWTTLNCTSYWYTNLCWNFIQNSALLILEWIADGHDFYSPKVLVGEIWSRGRGLQCVSPWAPSRMRYCGEGIAHSDKKRKKTWHRSPSFFNSPTQTSLIFSLKNNPRSPAAYVSADDPDVNMPSANFLSVTSLTCSVMTTGEFA